MISTLLVVMLAQNFDQRGFVEERTVVYPQSAPGDSGHFVNTAAFRYEGSYTWTPWLKLSGSVDAQTDTHRQVARDPVLDVDDRSLARPAFSIRRLSATIHRGSWNVELGRQLIRWGRTDILNPTDRFAPKDYLSSVVDSQFLGVTAARVTYEKKSNTIDLIYQPWFTPSRTPLLNQRWTVLPPESASVALSDQGSHYPGRGQYGVRWSRVAGGYEYSLSYFDGNNYLPQFAATFVPPKLGLVREYSRLRQYGADFAAPLKWLTVKSEAAYYTSPGTNGDEYVLYVIQAERFVKEWVLVGGYAGEYVTRPSTNPLQFSPERGFAKSFVGHVGYTIDVNRSVSADAAVRAGGSFVRFEYSQAQGQHWRTTTGFAWLRGDPGDFLGQYHRNSYGYLGLRYSF